MAGAARGLFVTGTGTEVGKTVVAAAIARTHAARGERVAVFKPAESGLEELTDPAQADHELLRRAADSRQADYAVAPYRYGPALSPHLAAELGGEAIEPARLRAAAAGAADDADLLVCEGVGGLLVPLTPGYLVRDLARELGYPLVIAAATGLGTINHALLTLEAARAVGLEVAAVVLTPWPSQPSELERSNRETIERLGAVRVETLAELDLSDLGSWPALELG